MNFKKNNYEIQYKKILEGRKEIIIWGASSAAKDYIYYLRENGFSNKILYITDNNSEKIGQYFEGYEIVDPMVAIEYSKVNNFHIVIGSMFIEDIKNQLLKSGISSGYIDIHGIFIVYEKKLFNGLFKKNTGLYKSPYEMYMEKSKQFDMVYKMLNDELSKRIYSSILQSKIELNIEHLVDIYKKGSVQYFEDGLYSMISEETICDCGSYTGDTLLEYLGKYNSFKKYIAIEADNKNYKKLKKVIDDNSIENVVTKNLAVWDKSEILKFQSNESVNSQVSDEGSIEIKAEKLDEILKDETITFLKMDIEGAEENALLGAKEIIKRDKPILAICLYHSLEDFYKIPLLIKEINPDYHLYVRHYTPMFNTETVCYAIPTERLIK